MADDSDDAIRERLRVARARYKKEPAAYDPALVPTADLLGPRRLDSSLTTLKERIDREVSIIDIYSRFMPAHKVRPAPKSGQRESIKFSCPSPSHPDEHPSAWTNIDGLWYCEPCGAKGDKYTVAAIGSGLDTRHDFPEVCTRIADAFGIDYTRVKGVTRIPGAEPEDLFIEDILPPAITPRVLPYLEWRKLFPIGTFLRSFMDLTDRDDVPNEFYLWEALMAVGLAIGRDCGLRDFPMIYGNLYVCLYGPSGFGKSRAMRALFELLAKALPYQADPADDRWAADPPSKGVKPVGNVGSPESLVDAFSSKIRDPSNPSVVAGYASVRGLPHVDELSSLLSRGDRTTGMKGQYTTMYDSHTVVISSRKEKNVRAEGIFCSLLTSTQPDAVAEYLTRTDVSSGFANRFIFVKAHPKEQFAVRDFELDFTACADELHQLHAWATFHHEVNFDEAGLALYEKFFQDHIQPLKLDEHSSPLFTRIDLTIKKIILLLAVNDKSTVATADIVERAIEFYDYLKFCYEDLSGTLINSIENGITDWLDEFIPEWVSLHGRGPTGRDLQRKLPKRYNNKQLDEALARQERIEHIHKSKFDTTAKGGRPTFRYYLRDQITEPITEET